MFLRVSHDLEQIGCLLEDVMQRHLAELLVQAFELQTLLPLHIRLIVGDDVEQNIVLMQNLIVLQIVQQGFWGQIQFAHHIDGDAIHLMRHAVA